MCLLDVLAAPCGTLSAMDALQRHDIETARATDPGVKIAQALELMSMGLRMKRAALAREFPDASDEEIEEKFVAWLLEND